MRPKYNGRPLLYWGEMGERSVADHVQDVRLRIASACLRGGRRSKDVTVVAISKGVPADRIRKAVVAGVDHLGENRVQEAKEKRPALAGLADLTWHMVGHLQTNKVKDALRLFDIIHSVDSFHLAEAISRRAQAPAQVFLEVNVSGEGSKYGLLMQQLDQNYEMIAGLSNVTVRGLMTVAPQSDEVESVRPLFRRLKVAADRLGLRELSMGMSDDFEVAVEEGATHLRIGRAIFGERA